MSDTPLDVVGNEWQRTYRKQEKRIAELEKELYEWVGWAQTMLKVVKGNKIVHGSLGGELECAITSRIAELESELADKENWCTTIRNLGGKVSRLRECLKAAIIVIENAVSAYPSPSASKTLEELREELKEGE